MEIGKQGNDNHQAAKAMKTLHFPLFYKTLQELRMLFNVTLNCQVAKIVMNSDSQFSKL